jgi:hypothetical protein
MRASGIVSALPDFAFAAVFLITWLSPDAFGAQTVNRLLLVMLLEFISIHSAAFMGTVAVRPAVPWRRALGIVGLGVFYSLFAGAFAIIFRTWWPLGAFWLQTGNRLLGVLGGSTAGSEQAFLKASWLASMLLYILCCFATSFLPLPALGITPSVIERLHLPGSGLWISAPYRVLAFGVLYYGLTAWWELVGQRWLERRGSGQS